MKSALLIMDAQNLTVQSIPNLDTIFSNIHIAKSVAKENHIPVIYVKVGFRNEYPEVHENNKVFSFMKENELYKTEHDASKIHMDVAPNENDIVVFKRRISAFTGSDLEVILRSLKVEHLIMTGFWTSGVILSTVCEAFDKDYKVTILSDCCGEPEIATQDFLMTKIFPSKSDIFNIKNWKLD